MSRHTALCTLAWTAGTALLLSFSPAHAAQYPFIDPGYTQEIYAGPISGGPGMAWTPSSHLLSRNGSTIIEYSPTQNAVHQGTNVHGVIATHNIAGLSSSGYGMTNGLDGYIYTVTGAGVERFNPSNWAAPAQLMPGSVGGAGYGITTLPDGRLAYSDGSGASSVWIYDPVALTNTYIYTGSYLIDGMIAGPGGEIAVTGQSNSTMTILNNVGGVINTFNTPHYPDGLAFSASPSSYTLYSNNNDGTITRYVFGVGYTGAPSITDIATGSGSYGDLAAVGPDCAFYVSQNENGSYHGATPGVGTNWNAGTNAEKSFVRIGALAGPDGTVECFYTPYDPTDVPEPSTFLLAAIGLAGIGVARWRRRVDN